MTDIPEAALRARQMYEEGATTREIVAQTKLSTWAVYYWVAGGPKTMGVRALPALPKRRMVIRRKILKEDRVALVNRMMKAAERQVCDIEMRLAGMQQEAGDRERDARTLAVLAKTMQSLTALDALHEKGAPKPKAPKNESIPRSIDELRRSVAQKLEAIIARRDSGSDCQS
ncbi:hypothetical protein [Pseudorhodoplanes sinuspersici]|uniref:Uncharacterized protein n=1 Tax=Pseudorhodoplanes sinuspersici TaxID=1235591 RepID=A0A1W6ZUC5_9HYPH|nr:hypothetical protein [Pseudorhodoplanes sinuspersici]ARQ00932.1 hypothetical protein CAK95_18930 [Pseudorhodoplanes sinuspersici]RKE72563.1 hypothetical protein DFP91_0431 [Pseudorhodoplanes sinuspersici]